MSVIMNRFQKKILEILIVSFVGGVTVYLFSYSTTSIFAAIQAVFASLLAVAVFFSIYLYGPVSVLAEFLVGKFTKSIFVKSLFSALFFLVYSFSILSWQQIHPQNFSVAVIFSSIAIFAITFWWESRTT